MLIVSIILSVIILMLVIEKLIIQKSVQSLQLRIHVNGTRGKSSVTEYIAAGLLSEKAGVMAKITGIIPAIIKDGTERQIKRIGVARVQEQMNIIRLAAREKVKSLVMECMSVSPELQALESRVFKPHVYVITNIKDDHREVMGRDIGEQADSICSAIPSDCTVITGENCFLEKIRKAAGERNSRVITAECLDDSQISNLPAGVFAENIALALTVCKYSGVDKIIAEKGIFERAREAKSPYGFVKIGDQEIGFLNAFAVNDVESTDSFIKFWVGRLAYKGKYTVIFNTRSDRPERTRQFASWIADNFNCISGVIITGNHAASAKKLVMKSGHLYGKVYVRRRGQLKSIREDIASLSNGSSMVVGLGNIAGDGFIIINELK